MLSFALALWPGKTATQVLSAKPGQRPTRWFDWADLRKMMLGWVGYKILAFKIEKAA